jgi:prolyl 4-hydroxylase
MPKAVFDREWKSWIDHNVRRGCSKDELFRILVDEGFDQQAAKEALDQRKAANPILIANLRRFDSRQAELYTAASFLSAEECRDLVALIKGQLRPSTITVADEPDQSFRTSRTCDLMPGNPVVDRLDARICAAMQISPAYAEPTQGQYYDIAQEFKPHTDYFESYETERFTSGALGQRTWTFMIYLNQPASGGETAFVNLGIAIRPQAGLAVIWNNLRPDGQPNPDTLHHGTPVTGGSKAIITKWFRRPA